jgi:hypothetical protein
MCGSPPVLRDPSTVIWLSIPISVPGCATIRRPRIALKPPLARTHFRFGLPSTAPSIGMRITINVRKHAALSRQTVKLNALTSSAHAPQPCHHGYALLPNWRPLAPPTHTFRATNSPTPAHDLALPNSTTHTLQPTLHNHQSNPPPARRAHSTTNTQSANPTTPLKPIQTGRFSPPDRIHPQTTGSQIATC